MHIRALNIEEFTNFEQTHSLTNLYQTISYGMLMAEYNYDYEIIGLVNDNDIILGASLILLKKVGLKNYYGYAPRGFLIDYNNYDLVRTFTNLLKKYYAKKNVIFIKTNPNIAIGKINKNNYNTVYNDYNYVNSLLTNLDYKKLKNNLYFEASLPRFNALIDLENTSFNDFSKNTKNKIRKSIRKGLTIELANKEQIDILSNFNTNYDAYFLKDLYTVYNKNYAVDYFLVSIDYNKFLDNSQIAYDNELEKNNFYNNKLSHFYSEKLINRKMNSDKVLLSYKNDILEATKGISDNNKVYLAAAIVIKHNNTATILYSGFDNNYKRFAPNYYLYYQIFNYYKNKFKYLDLNGVVGDFTNDNPYHGLNRFKLGYNPNIYEFIGEFDLIIDSRGYESLLKNGILAKEFNKNNEVK